MTNENKAAIDEMRERADDAYLAMIKQPGCIGFSIKQFALDFAAKEAADAVAADRLNPGRTRDAFEAGQNDMATRMTEKIDAKIAAEIARREGEIADALNDVLAQFNGGGIEEGLLGEFIDSLRKPEAEG